MLCRRPRASRRNAITIAIPPTNRKAAPAAPHQVHGDRAVLAGRRIVVEAEQENLVHRRADLIARRLHQAQADIARRILHAVEILRYPALRGQDHDGAGVSVLVGLRVVLVMEPDGIGQRADVSLVAGEKVPAIGGVRAGYSGADSSPSSPPPGRACPWDRS